MRLQHKPSGAQAFAFQQAASGSGLAPFLSVVERAVNAYLEGAIGKQLQKALEGKQQARPPLLSRSFAPGGGRVEFALQLSRWEPTHLGQSLAQSASKVECRGAKQALQQFDVAVS